MTALTNPVLWLTLDAVLGFRARVSVYYLFVVLLIPFSPQVWNPARPGPTKKTPAATSTTTTPASTAADHPVSAPGVVYVLPASFLIVSYVFPSYACVSLHLSPGSLCSRVLSSCSPCPSLCVVACGMSVRVNVCVCDCVMRELGAATGDRLCTVCDPPPSPSDWGRGRRAPSLA